MRKWKKWIKFVCAGLFLVMMSSCTANFCSNKDKANMYYVNYHSEEGRKNLIATAEKQNYDLPTEEFWLSFDEQTLNYAKLEATAMQSTLTSNEEILEAYGYSLYLDQQYELKSNKRTLWENFDQAMVTIEEEIGAEKMASRDFVNFYKKTCKSLSNAKTNCISPVDGKYGEEGTLISIEGKSWGYAWSKGLLEGLLVYPISWIVHSLSVAFGANTQAMSGWAQLLALLVVTIIVRGLMFLATFKSTMQTQKMTALSGKLSELQEKYPNANTNQAEKQQLAMAQMELYKKNGIKPFSQIIVMIVQFPVFICVWSALQGAAILSTGTVLGLELSAQLGASMLNFDSLSCITAWALFVLMSVTQFLSMKLPQWMQKRRTKNTTRLGKNPNVDSQQKQMKMMSNIMLIMIIVMGFSLPAAMGVYWFVSALFGLGQTVITQKIMEKSKK